MIVLLTVRSVALSSFGIFVSSSVTVAGVDCILTVVILSIYPGYELIRAVLNRNQVIIIFCIVATFVGAVAVKPP